MSLTDIHKKKRRKNLVLLALIFAWCALIWAVTMIKLAHAEEPPTPVACTMEAKECPDGSFVSRTGPDCAFASCPGEASSADAADEESSLDDVLNEMEADSATVEGAMAEEPFLSDPGKFVAGRTAHRDYIKAQPAQWWENWQEKLDPEK